MKKILVAYFSHSGTTRKAARMIADVLQADSFEIETTREYPEEEERCIEVARVELNADIRPELKGELPDLSAYDTLIVGFPNWHDSCPMGVMTFLESFDLTGKTVYPFVTHEGSGPDGCNDCMARACKGAALQPAHDGNALTTESIKAWIA